MKKFLSLFLMIALTIGIFSVSSNAFAQGDGEEPAPEVTEESASEPTAEPTEEPTAEPTEEPTAEPTEEPTAEPTEEPTAEPTEEPTAEPTEEPTAEPTEEPTAEPTEEPTAEPTEEPTAEPTEEPTAEPTEEPTAEPTAEPTEEPTAEPTAEPTEEPTAEPPVIDDFVANPSTLTIGETSIATTTLTWVVTGATSLDINGEDVTDLTEQVVEVTETTTFTLTAANEGGSTASSVVVTVEVAPVLDTEGEIESAALTNIPFTSRVGVMDMSGSGGTVAFKYYEFSNDDGTGGASAGNGSSLALSANQMRIVDQGVDPAITDSELKGSAVVEADVQVAAAVFYGGNNSSGYNQYEAYESGGFVTPDSQYFIPNANKKIGGGEVFSEIAIQNTEDTETTVDIEFVTQGYMTTVDIAPFSTYFYSTQDDTNFGNGIQEAVVITARDGKNIIVTMSNFRTKSPVNLSDTPRFQSI
jgi:hypothetical protein